MPGHPAARPGASGRRHPTRGSLRLPLVPSHQLRPPVPSRRPVACKSLLERLPKVLLPSSLPSSLPGLPTLPAKVCYRPVPTAQRHDAVLPCSLPGSSKSSLLCYRCQDFGARGKGLGRRVPAPRGRRIALPAREAREGREARHDDEVDRPITIIIGRSTHTLAALAQLSSLPRSRPGPRLLTRQRLCDRSRFTSNGAARRPAAPFVDTSTRPRCECPL